MMKPTLPQLPQFSNRPHGGGLGWMPGQHDQSEALSACGLDKADTYDMLIQVATIITATVEGVYHIPVKSIAYGAQFGVDTLLLQSDQGSDALERLANMPNPFFSRNGIATGGQCSVTYRYLVSRRLKRLAASGTQIFGDLSSLIPMSLHMNVTGAAYHGQAAALTSMHLARLGQLALADTARQDLQDWCKLLATVKSAKLSIRGGQMVGAVVPMGSMPVSIAAAVAKAGIRLTTVGACYAAAASIHWAAYVEQGWAGEEQHALAQRGAQMRAQRGAQAGAQAGPGASQADLRIPDMPGGSMPNFSRPLAKAAGSPAHNTVPNFSRPLAYAAGGPAHNTVPNFSRPMAYAAGSPAHNTVPDFSRPLPQVNPGATAPPANKTKGAGAGAGPASAIFWEVFTKRGASAALGAYDVTSLVREPAGWLALGDKLMLI